MSIIYISILISVSLQATFFSSHNSLASAFFYFSCFSSNRWESLAGRWRCGCKRHIETRKSEGQTDRRGTGASWALDTPSVGLKLRPAVSCRTVSMDFEHQSSAEGGATINALGIPAGFDSPA